RSLTRRAGPASRLSQQSGLSPRLCLRRLVARTLRCEIRQEDRLCFLVASVGEQQVTAEAFLRVEPRARQFEAGGGGEIFDAGLIVLVGVLGVNQLSLGD